MGTKNNTSIDLMTRLPNEWHSSVISDIREMIGLTNHKVVVLDDDPTGTQTVHDVPILTEWSAASLEKEFKNNSVGFYILTNTRSFNTDEARKINHQIGFNLSKIANKYQKPFHLISRGDSTLRGHFPSEVQALADSTGINYDAWILLPAFIEGGRITINDIHYVDEGGEYIPAGLTQFAKDKVFGYKSSNLNDWIIEKFCRNISPKSIRSISINDIRKGGPKSVRNKLSKLDNGQICIVNAVTYSDIEVFSLGMLLAESDQKKFMLRTAASYVRTRMGLSAKPLIEKKDLQLPDNNGALIIVGSYVPKTTEQLNYLTENIKIMVIEIEVSKLIIDDGCIDEISRVSKMADHFIKNGKDVVITTSRELLSDKNKKNSLKISQKISSGLTKVVEQLSSKPKFILAKGGITSSDIATKSLNIKRAMVIGQIYPGVPIWRCGDETKYPGLNYIVFPGNVGNNDALYQVIKKLQ